MLPQVTSGVRLDTAPSGDTKDQLQLNSHNNAIILSQRQETHVNVQKSENPSMRFFFFYA